MEKNSIRKIMVLSNILISILSVNVILLISIFF